MVGKTHGNAKFVQFINCTECLSIITSEAIRPFNDNMGEATHPRILQQSLVVGTKWRSSCQHVSIFSDNWQI
ncbi:MAG: hypothetical protein RIC84_22830 [Aggregatilineales bacterium]